jgi:hypothetical protein
MVSYGEKTGERENDRRKCGEAEVRSKSEYRVGFPLFVCHIVFTSLHRLIVILE